MAVKTLADAHYEADCNLVCQQWGREIALVHGASLAIYDQNIVDCTARIVDLTAAEAPPGDLVAERDAFFQARRDQLVDQQTKWDIVVNDPAQAAMLYPDVSEGEDAVAILAALDVQITALDAVWTP